jgi:hypothetical protein
LRRKAIRKPIKAIITPNGVDNPGIATGVQNGMLRRSNNAM